MKDLIATQSLSSQEGKVIKRVQTEMKKLGYDEVRVDPDGQCDRAHRQRGKRVIAIDGHVDTVDVGDLKQWKTDPFTPVLKNGILYGRGTSDMKGGVASAVYAGRAAEEIRLPQGCDPVRDRHGAGRGLRRPVLAVHREGRQAAAERGGHHRADQPAHLPRAPRPHGN
jgi:hypothetical protein